MSASTFRRTTARSVPVNARGVTWPMLSGDPAAPDVLRGAVADPEDPA